MALWRSLYRMMLRTHAAAFAESALGERNQLVAHSNEEEEDDDEEEKERMI